MMLLAKSVQDAMDAVSPVGHTIRETTSKSLGSVIKARNNVPHSRYVLPKLEMQQVLAWESMFDEDQLYDERLSEARIFVRKDLTTVVECCCTDIEHSSLIFIGILVTDLGYIRRLSGRSTRKKRVPHLPSAFSPS